MDGPRWSLLCNVINLLYGQLPSPSPPFHPSHPLFSAHPALSFPTMSSSKLSVCFFHTFRLYCSATLVTGKHIQITCISLIMNWAVSVILPIHQMLPLVIDRSGSRRIPKGIINSIVLPHQYQARGSAPTGSHELTCVSCFRSEQAF